MSEKNVTRLQILRQKYPSSQHIHILVRRTFHIAYIPRYVLVFRKSYDSSRPVTCWIFKMGLYMYSSPDIQKGNGDYVEPSPEIKYALCVDNIRSTLCYVIIIWWACYENSRRKREIWIYNDFLKLTSGLWNLYISQNTNYPS